MLVRIYVRSIVETGRPVTRLVETAELDLPTEHPEQVSAVRAYAEKRGAVLSIGDFGAGFNVVVMEAAKTT